MSDLKPCKHMKTTPLRVCVKYSRYGMTAQCDLHKYGECKGYEPKEQENRMSDLIDRGDVLGVITCFFKDLFIEDSNVNCAELEREINRIPTIDAVPIKFIDEVIEYITKCRDYAQHEVCKGAWDEQRQTLIMLLHEWAAWNECGRTGKYGEWKEE